MARFLFPQHFAFHPRLRFQFAFDWTENYATTENYTIRNLRLFYCMIW